MHTKVYRLAEMQPEQVEHAFCDCASIIKAGGLVAFPTETVYGLGALATSSSAVQAIFRAKGRPQDNPLIVHIQNEEQLRKIARRVPESAAKLAKEFWPGPLTLVLETGHAVAEEVSAGLDTVGVRMPAHPVALELIRRSGPLAAPSANTSGRPSPTCAEHVLEDLDGKIHAVLDAGPTGVGLESTVLDLCCEPPAILRPGGVSYEAIRQILPDVLVSPSCEQERPRSPGQKYTHYAPKARLVLVSAKEHAALAHLVGEQTAALLGEVGRVGILATRENAPIYEAVFAQQLREGRLMVLVSGSRAAPAEIAASLFDRLRQFDAHAVDAVVAEGVSEVNIGRAIMDRLRRAASKVVTPRFHVLFLCTGNTCRSPMAEALFREIARERGIEDRIEFSSAGIAAVPGMAAAEHAIQAVGEELRSHASRELTKDVVSGADLILTMTEAHKRYVTERYPHAAHKVHTLPEYVEDAAGDVEDPFGGTLETYEKTREQIQRMAELFFERFLKERRT